MIGLHDDDKDYLTEILDSPGWRVLMNRVVADRLAHYNRTALSSLRSGKIDDAVKAVANADGILDVFRSAYEAAGLTAPELLKKRNQ